MKVNTDTLIEHATRYAKNGYKLVPCRLEEKNGKKAVTFLIHEWKNADILENMSPGSIEAWIDARGANAFLGIHPDTVVIDFDSDQALSQGRQWLQQIDRTPRVKVKPDKGQHWYFLNDGSIKNKQHLTKIDVQVGAANGGVFIAGSWHPVSKKHYEILSTDTGANSKIGQSEIDALKRITQAKAESPPPPPPAKKKRFSKSDIKNADWSPGARNTTLNLLSFKAARLGSDKLMYYCRIMALEAGLTDEEITATQESARKGAIQKLLAEPDIDIEYQYSWAPSDPLTIHDAYTLKHVFDLNGIGARFNIRSQRIELRFGDDEWMPVNDRNAKQLATEIARQYAYRTPSGQLRPLKYSLNGFLEDLLAIVASHEADPFIDDYLDKLPEWDGIERIDMMLTDLFGTQDTELNRWASRFPFIGAIQRAYKPGCKLDEMPVLFGRQGTGKSTLLQAILPHHLIAKYDLFTDQVDFQARHKELIEVITGRVIVECQEMRGATKTDHAKIKAFLTSQNDNSVRAAYARFTESRPRRCIFVGTTDRPDALPNDPAGNRRFVFIRLGSQSQSVTKFLDEPTHGPNTYRDQAWAEALHKYKDGLRANLPRSLFDEQKRINEGHRSSNEVLEDVIEKHLQDMFQPDIDQPEPEYIRASSLYKKCIEDIKHIKEYQIRNYLTMQGYESIRVRENGRTIRAWQKINP